MENNNRNKVLSFGIVKWFLWLCILLGNVKRNVNSFETALDENYDGQIPISGKTPLEISASLVLEAMDVINYNEQEITMFLELKEEWVDFRLNKSTNTINNGNEQGSPINEFKVDDSMKIWRPDSIFLQSKETNDLKSVTRIKNDGTIQQISKKRLSIHCPMDFFYFPFDKQTCQLRLINEHSNREIVYVWNSLNVRVEKGITDNNLFTLEGYSLRNDTHQDEYSELVMDLILARKMERNFSMFYFPVITLCVIAFISLWLREKLKGVYFSLIAFLVLIIFVVGMLPTNPSSRMGLLDHYYFICANLVFNAFITNVIMYALLLPPNKPIRKRKGVSGSDATEEVVIDCNNDDKFELKENNPKSTEDKQSDDGGDHADDIFDEDDPEERIRRMGKFKEFIYFKSCKPGKKQMPITFTVLNIIYWLWIGIALLVYPKGQFPV